MLPKLISLFKNNLVALAVTTRFGRLHPMVNNPVCKITLTHIIFKTRMWTNAQRDGRPAEHRWRPLFNATKFG